MTKDWQLGSNFVKEPKITKIVGKNKDGYGDAETIETPNTQESTTVTVKGTKALRADKQPVKQEKFVKDTNPVKGTRAARKQKPVTWT